MKTAMMTRSMCVLFVMTWPALALATDPDTAGVGRLFARLEQGLRKNHEPTFKTGWLPESYAKNLVGGSGVSGASVFRQGTRKRWVLKPQLDKLQVTRRGAPYIVPADVWSWEKARSLDKVFVAVIWQPASKGQRWIVLGAGEKLEQVKALAERYLDGKPLAPPRP